MNVAFVTGTRAEYGLMRPVLFALQKDPFFNLKIYATGIHLMKEFGSTVELIRKDGFEPEVIPATYAQDTRAAMSEFLGNLIVGFTKAMDANRADVIFLIGDRAEPFAAASVGAYLGIPVAHLHGGEVTSTIDEIVRHAITKLSHIHLPATEKSAERIRKLGEEAWRIHVVGAPGIEAAINYPVIPKKELYKKYGLDMEKKTIIVTHHPAGDSPEDCASQMRATLNAVNDFDAQIIVCYPNADAGGRAMIEEIKKTGGIIAVPSLPHEDFLNFYRYVDVLVGNSSSGIIEAPAFGLPVVNIGDRQSGRERGKNVIESDYSTSAISKSIKKALDPAFRKSLEGTSSPYGDGKTSEKVISVLKNIKINRRIIQKRITY